MRCSAGWWTARRRDPPSLLDMDLLQLEERWAPPSPLPEPPAASRAGAGSRPLPPPPPTSPLPPLLLPTLPALLMLWLPAGLPWGAAASWLVSSASASLLPGVPGPAAGLEVDWGTEAGPL